MNLNEDTWHIIKNTPKLSGFLGTKGKPIPISNDEAKRISGILKERIIRFTFVLEEQVMLLVEEIGPIID